MRIATDGSSLGNPGPGGWCWWASDNSWQAGSSDGDTTNNAMELSAVLKALEHCNDSEVEIYTDSRYAIDCVTKWIHGWKKRGWKNSKGQPVANRELIEGIEALMQGKTVKFIWVRGHQGHVANEAADKGARDAAGSSQRGALFGPGHT